MGIASLTRRPSVEHRVSPENPSTSLSNPASWLSEALGAGPTTSGLAVNERTALTYAAFYACVNVLSKDVAQLPVFVYKRDGEERSPAREHDVWRVMHDRPNEMMTPLSFKQTLQAHAVSWGNGYAEIEFGNDGRVRNLWPLLPDRTKVVVRDGRKWVTTRVRESDGSERWVGLSADRVFHVPGLGFDGITGYSVVHLARNAIGAGMAAEEFSARLFANGATPRYALKHPKTLTPDARRNLELGWTAATSGLSNAHRTAVLEEGLTVEKLGLPAKDAEMIETSRFGIEQMARFFDIPMMRLHSTTAITSWGTGLEQWQRAYLVHTLGPWLVQWEETGNWSLFSEEERPVYFMEFLREAFLQADSAARAALYSQLFQVAAMSPNQIARKENLPSMGPAGDQRFVPMNLIPLDLAGQLSRTEDPPPAPANTPADEPDPTDERAVRRGTMTVRQHRSTAQRFRVQNSYRRVFEQTAEWLVAKHVAASRRAADRLGKDDNVPAFQQWAREYFAKERQAIQDAFLPVTLALGELVTADVLAEIGSHADLRRDIDLFAKSYVEALAVRESNRSTGQLIALSQDSDTADETRVARISKRLDAWEADRAKQIGGRESVQSGNAFARNAYELSGVQRLMWVAAGSETCELCQSMNGRIVSMGRPFVAAGESVSTDDDHITTDGSISHPPLHRGCVCVLVAA